MKRLLIISIELLIVFSIHFSCKKQTIIEYKVVRVENKGTLPCKYILRSSDGDEIEKWDICGKYKQSEVVLRVVE